MTDDWHRLKTIDELAAALSRSRYYVSAMKRAGFLMPGGTATVIEARDWLRDNPQFSSKEAWRKTRIKHAKAPRIRSI